MFMDRDAENPRASEPDPRSFSARPVLAFGDDAG